MKTLHSIIVKGKNKSYSFDTYFKTKYRKEYEAQGLTVHRIHAVIPLWWLDLGLKVRWWCFLQDIFNFKNPFRK